MVVGEPTAHAVDPKIDQKAQINRTSDAGAVSGAMSCDEVLASMPEESPAMRELFVFSRALALALLAEDPVAALVSASRLRTARQRVRTDDAAGERTAADAIVEAVAHLLARAPLRVDGAADVYRFARWLDFIHSPPREDHAHLFELEAEGGDLNRTDWRGLHIVNARLAESVLLGSDFDGAHLRSCDLSRVNAAGTSWRGARVSHTRLGGAMLTDAALDSTVFEDCDLRGAHLGTDLDSALTRSRFIRCDLRDTYWGGRRIAGVQLIDCKVFGIRGAAKIDAVEIEGADGSSSGDGSVRATPNDVVRAWRSWLG